MLQSKQRLLELNAKLAENLTSKGVEATADETTTALVDKVADITSGDDTMLKGLIQRDLTEIVIPDGVTKIGSNAFSYCGKLSSITIPNSVTSIGANAFSNCFKLSGITIPNGITRIEANTFANCQSLQSITIPNGVTIIDDHAFYFCKKINNITIPNNVTSIGKYAFGGCTNLESITIPSSVTSIGNSVFYVCSILTSVIIGNGFNANNLEISATDKIERETAVNMFIALADRTGLTAYTLILNKAVADKLTDEDKAIPTAKNWTIVYK